MLVDLVQHGPSHAAQHRKEEEAAGKRNSKYDQDGHESNQESSRMLEACCMANEKWILSRSVDRTVAAKGRVVAVTKECHHHRLDFC